MSQSQEEWEKITNADICLPLNGSFMKGSVIPIISSIRICPVPQEQIDNFSMAKRASIVKRNKASIISCVDIGTTLK